MNYKLKTNLGSTFTDVATKAKVTSILRDDVVEFEFNGINCLVNSATNLDWLYRDYSNSWGMGWKEVGPDCCQTYSGDIKLEFERKTKEAEEKRRIEAAEYKAKEVKERAIFEEKVKDVRMQFKALSDLGLPIYSSSEWDLGKSKNTDEYGACIYEYAEGWAKLMQVELAKKGYEKVDVWMMMGIAENTSHEMGFLGITGFMYGAAVNILSQCWIHGETLRKWHNKEYNHEGEGVVNPAILTISN
jgi:hypothetical protein